MNETKICVIGLGYVGLPLARLFSTKYKTIGFDMNQARVTALMAGHDATLEVSDELLQSALANGFKCTANIEEIRDYNFYVVAVPHSGRQKQQSGFDSALRCQHNCW